MRKQWTLFILGVIIFFFPFLGFPPAWKTIFLLVAGFTVAAIALSFVMNERNTSSHRALEHEHPNSYKG